MKEFIHPDTKEVYAISDTCTYMSIHSDIPARVGQIITVQNFRLIDGQWIRQADSAYTVDENDLNEPHL